MEPVSADIKYYEKSRQGFVTYVVEIGFRGSVWHLKRRFNDFSTLHMELRRDFPALLLPNVPPKRFFGRFDPNFLNDRSARLQKYLESVIMTVPLAESQALVDFLEISGNVAWERPGGLGVSGEFDSSGKETAEQERLTAIVEETAKALIDVSRTGVELLDTQELIARREKLLLACDGFKAHAAHLKNYFHPHIPVPSDSVSGEGVNSLIETLSRPPSIPAEDQRLVMERCSILIMDHLRESEKIKLFDYDGSILCYMQDVIRNESG